MHRTNSIPYRTQHSLRPGNLFTKFPPCPVYRNAESFDPRVRCFFFLYYPAIARVCSVYQPLLLVGVVVAPEMLLSPRVLIIRLSASRYTLLPD